jgi:hypothetical protein
MKSYDFYPFSIILLLAAVSLTGCHVSSHSATSAPESAADVGAVSEVPTDELFATQFGTFSVPSGWVKNKEHSTDSKPFFVPRSYNGSGVPNNISVEYGTNHYNKDKVTDFGAAILKQLSDQTKGQLTGEITSSGTTAESGGSILTYKFSMQDRECTQYYIVGDQCYVMVYETNMDGSEDCDQAAEEIVNTFQLASAQ